MLFSCREPSQQFSEKSMNCEHFLLYRATPPLRSQLVCGHLSNAHSIFLGGQRIGSAGLDYVSAQRRNSPLNHLKKYIKISLEQMEDPVTASTAAMTMVV